jgi:hypothetical protein
VIQRSNNLQTPTAVSQSVQRTQAAQDPLQADCRFYNYGEKGHYASRCPNLRTRANQTATATPAPTRGANSIPLAAKQNYARGRINHVVVEEDQEAPDVVISMFLINDTSAIVLFDSRALYSFISTAYVEEHNLPVPLLKCQMIVSSPEGDMPEGESQNKGGDFVTNLIVFELKGIDVILGMDWLSKHKVLIDCAKKSVKLTTPDGKEFEFIAEPVVTAKGVANHAKVNQMAAIQGSEVPVVNEVPNVFPEELPSMPSD